MYRAHPRFPGDEASGIDIENDMNTEMPNVHEG